MNPFNFEPAVLVGLAGALMSAAVAFGLDITEEQRDAILKVLAIAVPLIGGLVTRQLVYSPRTVQRIRAGTKP